MYIYSRRKNLGTCSCAQLVRTFWTVYRPFSFLAWTACLKQNVVNFFYPASHYHVTVNMVIHSMYGAVLEKIHLARGWHVFFSPHTQVSLPVACLKMCERLRKLRAGNIVLPLTEKKKNGKERMQKCFCTGVLPIRESSLYSKTYELCYVKKYFIKI